MSPKIFHIEDSDAFAERCAHAWQKGGFVYQRAAQSPSPLVESVRATHAQLIVTDLNLPGENGFAILRALAADPRTATLPRVLYTSLDDLELARRAGQYGARYFCKQRMEPPALVPIFKALLSASRD